MLQVIRYCFSQRFSVSAPQAYSWCTDFSPEDHALMGEANAEREVTQLTDSTLILKEIFHTDNGDIEKQKLVQLYGDRLSWVSTHLSGPNKFSQFIYEIFAEGDSASYLNFTALHIEHGKEDMTKEEVKLLAGRLCKYDSKAWKLLAKAMAKELKRQTRVSS
jgi:hypothetical protein